MEELTDLTVVELVEAYAARRLSPTEVVDAHLARLDGVEPVLNAFVLVDPEGARAAARAAEERWGRGAPSGPLDGVPLTVKDVLLTRGWPTRYGSATVDPVPGAEDAPEVARLRESGAVLLGKTTTSEFGWKGITDSPLFGTTRNPWDVGRSAGGSSGGAGASLAAGVGAAALGSDGGGSIRIPASYCGLVGLKPSFGRVPHAPQDSPYTTLISSGPLARTVDDAALVLGVLSAPDPRDWYALPEDRRDWRREVGAGVAGLRVAYTDELGGARPHAEVAAACAQAVGAFEEAGATVERVGAVFEPLRPSFEAYWKAGFAARLRQIPRDRWDLLDPGFRALAEEGLDVTLPQYEAAMGARAQLGATMNQFHLEWDLLVTPAMPTLPPPADVTYHSPGFDRWEHAVPYTVPFNLTGQPAVSVPCALVDGLPVGLQVVGGGHRDDLVLRGAAAYLAARPFTHRPRRPA